jgi:hypothetical protein
VVVSWGLGERGVCSNERREDKEGKDASKSLDSFG